MHRPGSGGAVLPESRGDPRRRPSQRRRGDPPRLRLPLRERRIRPCLRSRRDRLHRPGCGSHPPDGQQAPVEDRHARRRGAVHPRLRRRRTGRRDPAARGRTHRLPTDDQGQRRRRRPRHAPGGGTRPTAGPVAHRTLGSAGRLRQRRTDPGEGRAAPAPCGDPGVRRPPRQPALPRRTRLLGAAPPPEGHRGSSLPGARCRPASRHGRGGGEGRGFGQLRGRRHRRVSSRRGWPLLLPGDEYPPAGRTPGHRTGHRPGPGGLADPRRRGPSAAAAAGTGGTARACHRGPPLRRGRRSRLPAADRHGAALGPGTAARRTHRPWPGRGAGGDALLRPDAGQADRLRGDPRRSPAQADPRAGALRAAGGSTATSGSSPTSWRIRTSPPARRPPPSSANASPKTPACNRASRAPRNWPWPPPCSTRPAPRPVRTSPAWPAGAAPPGHRGRSS
ncbi:Uncharacterised protein [Pseudomonas aeruginosa]|nr:Uncharacterised protein [Pseudomonas aeruginosa]